MGRSDDTTRLYELEEKRNRAIKDCAIEYSKVLNIPENKFWYTAMPQALYDTLTSFDLDGAELAAVAFLESRGYLVNK